MPYEEEDTYSPLYASLVFYEEEDTYFFFYLFPLSS